VGLILLLVGIVDIFPAVPKLKLLLFDTELNCWNYCDSL